MILASLLFALVAALLHVYIFTMESITWTKPATWKRFSLTSQADAETTKPLAYNQGFYNLFLAIITLVGLALMRSEHGIGSALALAGTGSMLAAALVLVTHDRTMLRAALTQGTLPALAVLFLLLEL